MSELLTDREVQVLQLLADGKTIKDASRSLKLAESTLKRYAAEIRSKLEAPTTPNAVATAIRRGLND